MKKDGEKTWDKYIFVKSHFEDEERLRGTKRELEEKDFGRIHLCEVSLRRRRETSGNLADEERLREQKKTSGNGEDSGKKTSDEYIFVKSHFEDEERLRGKILWTNTYL